MPKQLFNKKYVVKNSFSVPSLPLSIPRKMAKAFKKLQPSAVLCPKCLGRFDEPAKAKLHALSCCPKFQYTQTLKPKLSISIVSPESSPKERRICERLAKISYAESGWDCPVLRRDKWISHGWQYRAYLLIDNEEVAGYIAMARVHGLEQDEFGLWYRDIIVDMYIVQSKRRQGKMRLLLNYALKSMRQTLETIWFQEPISEQGEKFLNNMSTKTGLPYRTC